MKDTVSVQVEAGAQPIIIEAGLLAQQAAGSVTVKQADTILFSAVTASRTPREGIDYFPLQIEYREKFYAAGRFPGGFFKREARPAEKEILTARITDRPIRPLFPSGYRNDVQINNMLLSADGETDSDMLSVVAASASLTISEIPFMGPIAGVRVGRVNGEFVINPTHEQRAESDLDLVYCSTKDLPLMIEGGGQEIKEADMIAAMKFAHPVCVKLIEAQLELRSKLGLPEKMVVEEASDTTILDSAREMVGTDLSAALEIGGKVERQTKVGEIKETLNEKLVEKFPEITKEEMRAVFDELDIELSRKMILDAGKRTGGRAADELRELKAQVRLLPRAHGSALFNRGETQALASVTLGTMSDSQNMDGITGGATEKSFMLHYNFPPYCVGEAGRLGFTSRREIGHGALAERSLKEVIPVDCPYTIRLVADIMGSNGSSSMASICVGTLALMDAGIKITRPVAGISIGLFSDGTKAKLVTDIIGAEDHSGDMDFKVAGTREGITGFQVDLKIRGLTWELVEAAFEKARVARNQILDFMEGVLAAPREDLSPYAPRIEQIRIAPDKIGALIGPGGKNIRRITETSGAQIDIEDDGTVSIFATNGEAMKIAVQEVGLISAEAEEGVIYDGRVTGIKEFGAFVEILPGKDGLVHISELADFRVGAVEDVCKMGDQMWVKCIAVDDRGRIKLSRKEAMHDRGEKDEK